MLDPKTPTKPKTIFLTYYPMHPQNPKQKNKLEIKSLSINRAKKKTPHKAKTLISCYPNLST